MRRGEPELVSVGVVLGVIDHDQFSLGQQQPGVAGAGLGLGLARRDLDDRDEIGRVRVTDRLLGRVVSSLDQDQCLSRSLG